MNSLKAKTTALIARFSSTEQSQVTLATAGAVLLAGVVLATAATAPTTTPGAWYTNMEDVFTLLQQMIEGPLGKILAVTCLIAGAAAGALKREFTWLLIGGFMALALGYGP